MAREAEGSPDVADVGDQEIKLDSTQKVADSVRWGLGHVYHGYRDAIHSMADDIKGYRPFKEDTSDWELDSEGNLNDPGKDEKIAQRKKILSEIGVAVMTVIGFALLGPAAGPVILAASLKMAEIHHASIDKGLENSKKEGADGSAAITPGGASIFVEDKKHKGQWNKVKRGKQKVPKDIENMVFVKDKYDAWIPVHKDEYAKLKRDGKTDLEGRIEGDWYADEKGKVTFGKKDEEEGG